MPRNTDLQAARDVRRAETLVEETHALDRRACGRYLRDRADELGVSIHAAALAVMSGDCPSLGGPPAPEPGPADGPARGGRPASP